MKKSHLITMLFLACTVLVNSQQLPTKSEIISTMKLVNDYWIETHPNPDHNNWDRATYFTGNMAFYQVYPVTEYLNYTNYWANLHNWGVTGGTSTRHADHQCVGQVYIDLYEMDTSQSYKIADITTSVKNMVDGVKSDDWWWVDALYMAMPVFTRLGVIYDDTSYFNKLYALYSNTKYTRNLYNSTSGLWYRDQSFLPPDTTPNGYDIYWSRGNGWAIAAHVRTLQHLPESDPHRTEYLNTFKAMAAALKDIQREDGFWNVSLADPNHYGGPETSGTSFFTYSMAWGINNGYLDSATYYPIIAKAWKGLLDTAVHENGKLGWVQGVGSHPGSSQPVTYDKTTDFGVGAFLLAGSELVKLAHGEMPAVPYNFVDSVKLLDRNTLEVYFNDIMEENSAEDTTNYLIDDSVKIRRATLSEDGRKVILNISTLQNGPHTITFGDIENTEGNVMETGYIEHFLFNLVVNVSASGYEDGSVNYPKNTIDGVLTSRWSQLGDDEWILYELESIDTITSLDIAFYSGNTRTASFDIELATDTTNFMKVYSGQSSGTTLELENYDITDTEAKFVKIVGHGNSSNLWNSITEVVINVKLKPDPELPEIINSIEEIYAKSEDNFNVYPNPFYGNVLNINVGNSEHESLNVRITDITGRIVYNNIIVVRENETFKLEVKLNKGIYIVAVGSEGFIKSTKLIVR